MRTGTTKSDGNIDRKLKRSRTISQLERVCKTVLNRFEKDKMARPLRLERKTLCLEGRCSIQLSYGRPMRVDSKRATTNYQAVFTIPNKMGTAD